MASDQSQDPPFFKVIPSGSEKRHVLSPKERVLMSEATRILKSVEISLDIATFLLNTDRGPQATDLCNEFAILLQNLGPDIHLRISDVLLNAYSAIFGIAHAERYAADLIYKFQHAGGLIIQLGDRYESQSRFIEAQQLFKSVLTIMQTIGHKRGEAMAHDRLGNVCKRLSEMQKAKTK